MNSGKDNPNYRRTEQLASRVTTVIEYGSKKQWLFDSPYSGKTLRKRLVSFCCNHVVIGLQPQQHISRDAHCLFAQKGESCIYWAFAIHDVVQDGVRHAHLIRKL